MNAVASLVHNIKSLYASVKSVQCAFSIFFSAFDSVTWPLLLRKLEQFGRPRSFLIWLSGYFSNITQCTRPGRNKSALLGNTSGAVFPLIFSTYISHVLASFPGQLYRHADDVVLRQSVPGTEDFLNFSSNFSLSVLSLNLSKCVEYLFTSSRSAYSVDSYFIKNGLLARVDSFKYLGITVDKN